jgi:hypothetical protein
MRDKGKKRGYIFPVHCSDISVEVNKMLRDLMTTSAGTATVEFATTASIPLERTLLDIEQHMSFLCGAM